MCTAGAEVRRCFYPHWSYCLFVALTVSLTVSLLLLPHFLSKDQSSAVANPLSCFPALYTGSICLEELSRWQRCLPERVNDNTSIEVLIPITVDQMIRESQATQLFTGLGLVTPRSSPECEREFRNFWCLLLFGLCDGDGQSRLPSYELCNSLQTDTCYNLIQFAASVPEFSKIVQNCNNFRFGNPPPCRNESESMKATQFNISCSDGFYYHERSLVCRPKCGEWTALTPTTQSAVFVLSIAGDVGGILMCSAILTLSFIQCKETFTFPFVLIIYQTLTVLAVSLLDLISFLPVNSLLCSSEDLLENLSGGDSSAAFCKFQGNLLPYAGLVVALFWLFQTALSFWVVTYPIHYRSFCSTGKLKIIHIISVISSLTLPIIPTAVMNSVDGFGKSVFTPTKCIPLNVDAFFYSVLIPMVIIDTCGISLLVITVWNVTNMKERLQKKPLPRGGKLKVPEVKLILLVIAYTCVATYAILASNIIRNNVSRHRRELENHFSCEALGDTEMDCSREHFGQINRDSIVETFLFITLSLYPSVFFVFLASPERCSRMCRRHKKENYEMPNYISLHLTCTTLC